MGHKSRHVCHGFVWRGVGMKGHSDNAEVTAGKAENASAPCGRPVLPGECLCHVSWESLKHSSSGTLLLLWSQELSLQDAPAYTWHLGKHTHTHTHTSGRLSEF